MSSHTLTPPIQKKTSALLNRVMKNLRARDSLRRTLLIAFLLLTLPVLLAISAITIWQQYENNRKQAIDQLTSVAILKESEATSWFNSLAPDLELVVANPRLRSDITQLINTQHNEIISNAWRGILLDTFKVTSIAGHKFEEIFLLDSSGTVVVSTNPLREGKSFATEPFFRQGLNTSYAQSPSASQTFGMATFVAVPVRDEKNIVQGVLVGVANLDALNAIMRQRAGLGRTGETYLVGLDHHMLTEPRDSSVQESPVVYTRGAEEAFNGRNGSALYENYQLPGVPVVGVYRWIPQLNVALVAEQSQAEAFEGTLLGIGTLLGATLVVAVLTVIAAILVSHSIATPLEDLTSLATRISDGDLTQTVHIERTDEIGTLANAFNAMTHRLRELFASLEQRVAARTDELRQELAERVRTEDALQKARNDLAVLYEVTATASQAVDLSTMLTDSLARIVEALHSDGGFAFLLEENREGAAPTLRLRAHQGISPRAVSQMDSYMAQHEMASWLVKNRESLLIPVILSNEHTPELLGSMDMQALVLAPMRAEGQVWGLLGLGRHGDTDYQAEEIALLSTLADQIGVVVRSNDLRQRARQATILEERQRLARELHDSVTQMLYSMTLFAQAARDSTEKMNLSEIDLYLTRMGETAQQALREMRLLIYESRPLTLEQEGLMGALRRRLEVVETRAGMETQLLTEGVIDLPVRVQMELYRIAQEALNNILKHSAATRVTIQMQVADGILLQIVDNGKGFASNASIEKAGIGLTSMRERAERLGGTLQIRSTMGEGTSVQVRLPTTRGATAITTEKEPI